MKDMEWKRDETPYLVFACYKCHQYSYVKTTQKTKKCLRCGYSHDVQNLLNKVETINGMTNALNRVKYLQNEYGKQELNGALDFAAEGSFRIVSKNRRDTSILPIKNKDEEDENDQLFDSFILLLKKLSRKYRTFPKYIIEIMAETKNIPQSEIPNLIRRALKEGHLNYRDESYVVK